MDLATINLLNIFTNLRFIMFKSTLTTLGLLIALGSGIANAAVWPSIKQWNEAEEKKYSEWVENKWEKDIFTDEDSKYHGIPTDCADAAYTMRMIYSYEQGLPFQIYSKRIEKVVSNEMTKWDINPDSYLEGSIVNLKDKYKAEARSKWHEYNHEEKKFWLFVRFVNSITSTWSLPNDTIMSPISREGVVAGNVLLKRRFHTYTVKGLDKYGNIKVLSSTLPAKVRTLSKGITTPTFRYLNEEGLLTFRWPNEINKAHSRIARQSNDQNTLWKAAVEKVLVDTPDSEKLETSRSSSAVNAEYAKLLKFGKGDIEGLSTEKEPLDDELERSYNDLCTYVKQRVAVVKAAVEIRKSTNACFSQADYDTHSTPGREKAIKVKLESVLNIYRDAKKDQWNDIDDDLRINAESVLLASVSERRKGYERGFNLEYWESRVKTNSWFSHYRNFYGNLFDKLINRTKLEDGIFVFNAPKKYSCTIEFGDGQSTELREFINDLYRGKVSSNPNDSLEARWGLSEERSSCPTY